MSLINSEHLFSMLTSKSRLTGTLCLNVLALTEYDKTHYDILLIEFY